MKLFHQIIILSIVSSFSLYAMNIVPHKNKLLKCLKKIKHPAFTEKTKQLCNMNDINILASTCNIIATGATGNPAWLYLVIPQMSYKVITFLREQTKKHPTLFDEDLALLATEPAIIEQLESIKKINGDIRISEFESLKYNDQQRIKRLNLTKSVNDHRNKIIKLEENNIEAKRALLEKIEPLLKAHKTVNISEVLKNYEYKTALQFWTRPGIVFSLVPLAIFLGIVAPTIVIEGTSCGWATPIELVALALSATAGVKNGKNILEYLDSSLIDNCNRRRAIDILKIQQAHIKNKNSKHTQTNE